ncbi:nucleotide-diphospho-sugar transferase [Prochlorococcus sp. AH-716-B04]|nr:nucleotide-diphospho-sugar transferase [Prochlorococcus sp. AH-716-B04]
MVPILITCWSRPEKVFKLIESIRPLAPKKIYVSCDGPNPEIIGNNAKVAQTRKIIKNNINWDCQLKTLFGERNIGCRYGMTRAINWFFENEMEGIILEDDCIPSKDFFIFCSSLLDKYRNNKKIWTISGNNFQDGNLRGNGSYYLSRYFHCWGWATWSDRWKNYDSDLNYWIKNDKYILLKNIFNIKKEQIYWLKILNNLIFYEKPDSWAYRWALTCFANNGLSLIPNKNLVNNIGFDYEATNTSKGYINTKIENGILPIVHPTELNRDINADEFTFYNHFNTASIGFKIRKAISNPLYYPKRIKDLIFKKI